MAMDRVLLLLVARLASLPIPATASSDTLTPPASGAPDLVGEPLTAVARDELQWFATGHRLVEALVGIVRDGDAGKTATLKRPWAPRRGAQ